MSEHEETLKCPLLFKKIEELRQHALEPAIWSDLFSKPRGSHEALHFLFKELRNENTPHFIKQTIDTVFKSASLREKVKEDWNLYCGYDHAKRHEHQMNEGAPYDLASRCIEECHSCFKGLLDYKIVEPSFFCQTGHSFFWLAVRSEQEELLERLLMLMSPKDLLRPFSVRGPGEDRYSIFQAATWRQTWFNICWERLESSPINGIPSLGPVEIGHICRFVEPNFAEKLQKSGLDLGKAHPEDAAPGWLSVATRRDPEPMFSWFLSSGSEPPEGLLTYVATHNCTEAATWVMDHTESHQDWCNAALAVAESADERSTTMLAIILPKFAAKWGIGQTLAKDIVIKIVRGVCEEVAKCDLPRMIFVDKEDYAINKIRILGGSTGEGHVVGMNIMAGNAGLYRLAMELENMKQHF